MLNPDKKDYEFEEILRIYELIKVSYSSLVKRFIIYKLEIDFDYEELMTECKKNSTLLLQIPRNMDLVHERKDLILRLLSIKKIQRDINSYKKYIKCKTQRFLHLKQLVESRKQTGNKSQDKDLLKMLSGFRCEVVRF